MLTLKDRVEKEKAFRATVRDLSGSWHTKPPCASFSAPLTNICSIPLCTQPSEVERFWRTKTPCTAAASCSTRTLRVC
jgi:hypothetical protein